MGKHKKMKARKRLHSKRREANQKKQALQRKHLNVVQVADEKPHISMEEDKEQAAEIAAGVEKVNE